MTYRSKIGFEILVPLILILATLTTLSIVLEAWGSLFVIIIAIGIILSFYLNTSYRLTNKDKLIIRSGFFRVDIEVSSIKKIRYTRNVWSSPALSVDRLEIHYNKFDSILISPKNRTDFIESIRGLNKNVAIIK